MGAILKQERKIICTWTKSDRPMRVLEAPSFGDDPCSCERRSSQGTFVERADAEEHRSMPWHTPSQRGENLSDTPAEREMSRSWTHARTDHRSIRPERRQRKHHTTAHV